MAFSNADAESVLSLLLSSKERILRSHQAQAAMQNTLDLTRAAVRKTQGLNLRTDDYSKP